MSGLADALGGGPVDLVGNSMGGFFCMAFACAFPERVRRLVLVGAPAGLDRPLPLFLRLWGRPLLGRLIGKMVAATTDPEALRRRVFRDLVAHPEALDREVLEIAIAAAQQPGAALAARTMLGAVATLGGWRRELMMREAMERLAVPTLFLWGDRDAFAPPASGEALAARMPNASVTVLDDVGHLPQLEAPARVGELIAAFLRAEPAARAIPA
jgi:pimeloyl-ACP methyl ester carboxylesterase